MFARVLVANQPLVSTGNIPQALSSFESFAKEDPEDATRTSLLPDSLGVRAVIPSLAALRDWEQANKGLLENPVPPHGDTVRLYTDAGNIDIAMYKDEAPLHVANFVKLASDNFYARTLFHRVVNSGIHIVQGGDPNTKEKPAAEWGLGNSGDGIPVERNKLAHIRGAVAMAQPGTAAGTPKSSGCQFYFVTNSSPSLDKRYTVFGVVTSGMDVVDKIAAGEIDPGSADRPKSPIRIVRTEVIPG